MGRKLTGVAPSETLRKRTGVLHHTCPSLSSPFLLFPQPQADLLSPHEVPLVFVQLCPQFSFPPALFRDLI